MDFVVFLVALIVWGVIWVSLYRIYRQRSWRWVSSQLMSGTMGTAAAFFVVVLALGTGLIEARQAKGVDSTLALSAEEVAERSPSEPVPVPAQPASKTFNFDDKRYLERLEQALKTVDHTRAFETRPVKRGAVNDARSIVLSPVVAITLGLDKQSGQVNAITVVGTGDGTDASGIEILIQASAALAAVVPGASVGEVMRRIPSLFENKPIQFGNIRLTAHKTEALGTWFIAEPV